MRSKLTTALCLAAAGLLIGALLLALPLAPAGLESRALPARTYDESLRRIDALVALDGPAISPECGTRLFTHGSRTRRVVVLMHGLTNCPQQFDSLGRLLFDRGANVLIPRLPRHGLADRMTGALAATDARELCAFTDRVVDAARGLGDSVSVAGLSVGGVLAAWAGQERGDIVRAVAIAPIFGVARAPGRWTPLVTRLALGLPNTFVWWDPERREDLLGPRHVYPRFATRAVAATLVAGAAVRARARRVAPACPALVMVTVGGDAAADNGLAKEVSRLWRAHGANEVITFEFPEALRLNHDVVDPDQVGSNPAVSYPELLRLIMP